VGAEPGGAHVVSGGGRGVFSFQRVSGVGGEVSTPAGRPLEKDPAVSSRQWHAPTPVPQRRSKDRDTEEPASGLAAPGYSSERLSAQVDGDRENFIPKLKQKTRARPRARTRRARQGHQDPAQTLPRPKPSSSAPLRARGQFGKGRLPQHTPRGSEARIGQTKRHSVGQAELRAQLQQRQEQAPRGRRRPTSKGPIRTSCRCRGRRAAARA